MEPVPLWCDVCNQQFSGPVPAHQHFISQKHRKKVETSAHFVKSDKFCDICNKNCDTLQMLQQHKSSPRHLAMVEKRNQLSNTATPSFQSASELNGSGQFLDRRSSASDGRGQVLGASKGHKDKEYVFDGVRGYCYLCKIDLTSESHATSHINGKNHAKKKNLLVSEQSWTGQLLDGRRHVSDGRGQELGARSGHMEKDYVFDGVKGLCYLCKIELTSESHASSHINGKNHAKKKNQRMYEIGAGDTDNSMSGSQESLNVFEQGRGMNVRKYSAQPAREIREEIPKSAYLTKCELCQVTLSSPKSAKEHYSGDEHRRKHLLSEQNDDKLECTICKVHFSCADNKRDHIASHKHRKAVDLLLKEESGDLLPLNCKICDCSFTGQESAEAHFNSKKHKRNQENWEIQHKCKFSSKPEHFPPDVKEANISKPVHDHRSAQGSNETSNVNYLGGESWRTPHSLDITRSTNQQFKQSQSQNYTRGIDSQLARQSASHANLADDDSFLAKPLSEADLDENNRSQSSEEMFNPKPISLGSDRLIGGMIPSPNDTSNHLLNRENIDHQISSMHINESSNNTDCNRIQSNYFTNNEFESLSEQKIKKETRDSLRPSLGELLMSGMSYQKNLTSVPDSGTMHVDQQPQFIRNNLEASSIGRGRRLMKMCNILTDKTPQNFATPDTYMRMDTTESLIKDLPKQDMEVDKYDEINEDDETKLKRFMSKINKQAKETDEEDTNDDKPELPTQKPGSYDQFRVLQYTEKSKMIENINTDPGQAHILPFAGSGNVGFTGNQLPNMNENKNVNNSKEDHGVSPYDHSDSRKPFNGIDAQSNNQRRDSTDSHVSGSSYEGSISGTHSGRSSTGSPDQDEYRFSKTAERGWCNVCSIELTSTNHMRQHVYGRKHNKAKEMWSRGGMHNVIGPSYKCDVCCVSLSGLEPQRQHLESQRHQMRVKQLETGGREFFCGICNIQCSGDVSYQQHLSGAQHFKMSGGMGASVGSMMDATIWYDCEVCKCRLNTRQQLETHKRSPRHLAKAQKLQSCGTEINDDAYKPTGREYRRIDGVDPVPHQFNQDSHTYLSDQPSLLDHFLSQPLFPDEYLSDDSGEFKSGKQQTEPKPFIKPEITDGPIPMMKKYAIPQNTPVSPNNLDVDDEDNGKGAGNAKRGHGSELAWALRSKGSGTSLKKDLKDDRTTLSSPNDKSVRSEHLEKANPYAATHHYYCHTCKVPMNTKDSLEAHIKGKRHLTKVCNEKAPDRDHLGRLNQSSDEVPKTKYVPRNYQVELFKKAVELDTLCFLPTGTGKTLVSVLAMIHMLKEFPSKNVLFLVDKVLLVLQQSKFIKEQIDGQQIIRYDQDSKDYQGLVSRPLDVAAVCMGQQSTAGMPMWKHDVVIVTAAFCRNLLDQGILKWTDFSLVIFDEAHHCKLSHPFNKLLQDYHTQVQSPESAPKILGLTASPAGKADVPKTLAMVESLLVNMGHVFINIVEGPDSLNTLRAIQSNAEMVVRIQSNNIDPDQAKSDVIRRCFLLYTVDCLKLLAQVSSIKSYIGLDWITGDSQKISYADFEQNLDTVQSCLNMIYSDRMEKVQFSLFTQHIQCICMAYNSLLEGGILCSLEELSEMESTDANFEFAKSIGLSCDKLYRILENQGQNVLTSSTTGSDMSLKSGSQIQSLITELIHACDGDCSRERKAISLVLVKQRSTAHKLCKVLNSSAEMHKRGLRTAMVVGHGGSGAADKGMNVNQQKRILEEIKQHRYQVVIATSVAEEGVDWPECDRVISMYPPSTVTALVQMRGRARQKDSKFIILCNDDMEEEKLRDVIKREINMMEATKIIVERQQHA